MAHVRVAATLGLTLMLAGSLAAVSRSQAPVLPTDIMAIDVPGGRLSGTLTRPAPAARPPVVLLIAGSGPVNRDGNLEGAPGTSDSLKLLAEALGDLGVATLRYDKRGVGASREAASAGQHFQFETMVEDAAAWITRLRNDARFTTVTVVGQGEGSLIGMLAARAARADGFVSLSGPSRRASDLLRDQLRPQLSGSAGAMEATERVLARLEAGETVTDVPPALASLFRPAVQPYLVSWFGYLPTEEIARLRMPVLIVQGGTDIQVPASEADGLLAASPGASIERIAGMNHVLKRVGADVPAQLESFGDPEMPVVPALPDAIAGFARRVTPIGLDGSRSPERPTTERLSPRITRFGVVSGAHLAIEYGQPSQRGREIWGGLVRWGRVWMPGADEATTLTTDATLVFDGLTVPPGDFTIYTLPAAEGVTLIVSGETGQFHTVHHADRDLGRVNMTRHDRTDHTERLTYAIEPVGNGGVLMLVWGDREYAARFTIRR